MNRPRVLVAGTPPAIDTVQRLLGTEVDTIAARSMSEALRGLQARPDLILCNARFDESRMLELLQAVKESAETRDTPFVGFHLRPAPAEWHHSVEVAAVAVGATAFIDLSALALKRDRDGAERALRELVFSHLAH